MANGDAGASVIRAARPGDFAVVKDLVAACGLPVDGLTEPLGEGFALAESATGVCGVAGVEVYGEAGLLRSVAVTAAARGTGLGVALVADRLAWARQRGLRSMYLLTTTAADFFPRFGFVRADRAAAPEELRASDEFAHACPASAVLMRLDLTGRAA